MENSNAFLALAEDLKMPVKIKGMLLTFSISGISCPSKILQSFSNLKIQSL
jgi:hypothetical protein